LSSDKLPSDAPSSDKSKPDSEIISITSFLLKLKPSSYFTTTQSARELRGWFGGGDGDPTPQYSAAGLPE
jgi:hypothetical protein